MVTLQNLLTEITELTRNATSGALDNSKRTRALNWVIQDLQGYCDWEPSRRTKEFDFIGGISEYSLKNHVGATCLDNDGATSVLDFKTPYDLRLSEDSHKEFSFRDVKDVRSHIRNGRDINEYGIDGDLIVINYPALSSALIHACDSLTADGTWVASGDASNLTIDEVEYKEGNGALNFDSAGTSLILTNASLTALNLSGYKDISAWTLWVYLPDVSDFSSIALKWGSSASAYWEKTETARVDGLDLEAGWNQFKFLWKDATPTGTPDDEAIDYLQITITYSASITDTDFRVDDIRIAKTKDMKLNYYSYGLVKNSSGAFQKEFNADDVTMTDKLADDKLRNVMIEGSVYRCFRIVGGARERDETDSFTQYEKQKLQVRKLLGHKSRRPTKVFKFQR